MSTTSVSTVDRLTAVLCAERMNMLVASGDPDPRLVDHLWLEAHRAGFELNRDSSGRYFADLVARCEWSPGLTRDGWPARCQRVASRVLHWNAPYLGPDVCRVCDECAPTARLALATPLQLDAP